MRRCLSAPAHHAQHDAAFTVVTAAVRLHNLMAPAAVLELRTKEDRLLIEMADQGGVDFAAFDGLQNHSRRFRRLKAAQVDMDGVGGSPFPGAIGRSSVVVMHGKAPVWRARVINRYHNA